MTAPAKRGRGRPPLSDEGGPAARLVAYVPAETKAALDHEAARLGVSAGELVREAVERHLRVVRKRQPAQP